MGTSQMKVQRNTSEVVVRVMESKLREPRIATWLSLRVQLPLVLLFGEVAQLARASEWATMRKVRGSSPLFATNGWDCSSATSDGSSPSPTTNFARVAQ